jgi:hypothetical protein
MADSHSTGTLLAMAKNAAGDNAAKAAERQNHPLARQWSALAMEIDRLLRNAVELLAFTDEPLTTPTAAAIRNTVERGHAEPFAPPTLNDLLGEG